MRKRTCFLIAITLRLVIAYSCVSRRMEYGTVCVCNDTYCDTLNTPMPIEKNQFIMITSSEGGDRFSYSTGQFSKLSKNVTSKSYLYINRYKLYQRIHGFGTSMTTSVSYILQKLPSTLRDCVYRSYFSNVDGMGLNMIRMPIGGSDCDFGPWAYNEYPENDIQLRNFTRLEQRELDRNDRLKEIMTLSKNNSIQLLAAAWGPPRWMKQLNHWNGSPNGKRDNQLKSEYYQTWAEYHLKWLELMAKDSIRIAAVSSGNEPFTGPIIPFQALSWNASTQAKWIAENLNPTLKKSKYSNVKIHGYDDIREHVLLWINEMLISEPNLLDFIPTIEVHGYSDHKTSPHILDELYLKFNKPILYSEMSFGGGILDSSGPKLGSWTRAEQFIENIMGALSHWVVGYIDWNMLLDRNGGPNYAQNFIDAAIMANDNFTEIFKQPLFYAMAHFAKFIPANSVRIGSKMFQLHEKDVSCVTFLRPDKRIVIILYNGSTEMQLKIVDIHERFFHIQLKPKSINTIIY